MSEATSYSEQMFKDRPKSRLEADDPDHCRKCGIPITMAAVGAGYERCPECYLEEIKEELVILFGSLNSVEAAPTHSAESHLVVATEDVLGGFVKVFDDDRVEFVPDWTDLPRVPGARSR